MTSPTVSIVVPCRNEVRFIAKFLDSVMENDYPQDDMEILIVDGMSNDGTRAVVQAYRERYAFIRVLDNPRRITPAALNIGIQSAQGEVIMRMDVHTEYPVNYISGLVAALAASQADNVGGRWVIRPGAGTLMAEAIAIALSHPFGVGNSYYRIGVTEPRWVDTVPYGCYRRSVFERFGLFDEELIRNQDDEFNLRLIRGGGGILLVPGVECYYYARDSLHKLWRMHYQYGYYKPLVIRKIGGVFTVRQVVPGLFVLTLAVLTVLAPWSAWAAGMDALVILAYLLTVIAVSSHVALRTKLQYGWVLPLVFPVVHVSYGIGFLRGIKDHLLLTKPRSVCSADPGLTR